VLARPIAGGRHLLASFGGRSLLKSGAAILARILMPTLTSPEDFRAVLLPFMGFSRSGVEHEKTTPNLTPFAWKLISRSLTVSRDL
jgi:hypothetical protein